MNKLNILTGVKNALEALECPCQEIESQPGLEWFVPLSDDYEADYATGEVFFSSDLTEEPMRDVDIVQLNLVFGRDYPDERADALRAYFSQVNRMVSGGRFDAQQHDTCFVEYGHDLIFPLDITDAQAVTVITTALDLAVAYITFAYAGVVGIATGDMTVDTAIESINM